ncbi:MAG: glycosyltransferase, partial [Thaumarchaeota archaeon]|nr:glycosyltransferase [Nitrososphaerota archaeon]
MPPTLQYKGGLPPGFADNIRYAINAVMQGYKVIKNQDIDIIHSNNFAPALAGSILSSLTSRPHITAVHDIFSLCGKNYWKQWGAQSGISKMNVWLAPFFEKLMIKLKFNCIHTVSETTRDDLVKFGARKPIHVIHNSIETNVINNTMPNPLQFVYVGRLVFY